MENTYLIEGEFAFQSYQPAKLKTGMHFLTMTTVGVIKPLYTFFTLEHVPEDEDLFMALYGAPIRLAILSADDHEGPFASGNEIGWFSNEKEMKLHQITDKEINEIFNEYDGIFDVECDEDGNVILYEGKVIISYLSRPETEEGEEAEDETN